MANNQLAMLIISQWLSYEIIYRIHCRGIYSIAKHRLSAKGKITLEQLVFESYVCTPVYSYSWITVKHFISSVLTCFSLIMAKPWSNHLFCSVKQMSIYSSEYIISTRFNWCCMGMIHIWPLLFTIDCLVSLSSTPDNKMSTRFNCCCTGMMRLWP